LDIGDVEEEEMGGEGEPCTDQHSGKEKAKVSTRVFGLRMGLL